MTNTLTVTTNIKAPADRVWQAFNDPRAIQQWNQASPDWYCPASENDLRIGGKFKHTMAARDGSFRFDFSGTYTDVSAGKLLAYTLDDDRKVVVHFVQTTPDATRIITEFEAESEHTLEQQQHGWQAILDSFKNHVENKNNMKNTAERSLPDIRTFIEKFNEGFARNDVDYILDQVADDLIWVLAGHTDVSGKTAFREQLEEMKNHAPAQLSIRHILVDGNQGVAEGTMTVNKDGTEEVWAFCDIYTLTTEGPLKITAMRSFVVQLN